MSSPLVGDRIEVFWLLGGVYYAGSATKVTNTGTHIVAYAHAEVETLNTSEESWRPVL